MTAGQIIDRVYREWLYRTDNAPVRTLLTGDVSTTAPTFTFNKDALSTEELALVAIGQEAEVGQELLLITDIPNPNQFTATRGFKGTTAAAHSSGDVLYLAPPFPRRVVFDAVADSIVDLYPDLWHTNTIIETSKRDWVEVPAATTSVIRGQAQYGIQWEDVGIRLLKEFPDSASNVAVQFPDWTGKGRVMLTLKEKFTRPSVEADQVSDIEEDWEQLVVLGTVVIMLASTDVDAVRQDFVTETFQTQAFPVGSGARLAREAIRQYEYKMGKARRELAVRYPISTVMSGVTYGAF